MSEKMYKEAQLELELLREEIEKRLKDWLEQ